MSALTAGSPLWWLRIALAATILFFTGLAGADALRLDPSDPAPSLAGHLSILIDETGELGLSQAQAAAEAGQFHPVEGAEVAPGFLPSGALWIRFTILRPAAAPADWWLTILHEPLDYLDLYLLGPEVRVRVHQGGRGLPFNQREALWNGHAFALDLEPPGQYQVYLRAATQGVFRVPLQLLLPGSFDRLRLIESFLFAATFGIATVALLLSLFRALRYRSAVDACYALYLLGLETGIFVLYGYFQEFGISDDLTLRITLGWAGYQVGALALLWLGILFVGWPARVKRRMWLLAATLTLAVVTVTVLVLLRDPRSIVYWTTIAVQGLIAGALGTGLFAAVRRWPGGLAFLLAFAPFIGTVILYQLGSFGFAHAEFLLSRSLIYLGIVIHVLLLFGIILNRETHLRHERDQQLAEERALLERRVAERTATLAEALTFNATLLLDSPLPMAVFRRDGRCVLVNDAAAALAGTRREVLLGSNFNDFAEWQSSGLTAACEAAIADHQARDVEARGTSQFGKAFWVEARILPKAVNGVEHLLLQFVDLAPRKHLEEELRYLAFHDPLTSLPNRRLLLDRLQQTMLRYRRSSEHGAVFFIDLDHFKQLNDDYGHDVGDRVLLEVATRLRRVIRGCDTAARLAGDEFVMLLVDLGPDPSTAARHAEKAADRIREVLAGEYDLGSARCRVETSVGFTLISASTQDIDQVLRQADLAMYESKRKAEGTTGSRSVESGTEGSAAGL